MTTNGNFGTLTIKNSEDEGVTKNCILNVGINVIGSSVNANVRLHDLNVDQQQCIVEVKENGLVTIAALHIFPQSKVNDIALLKNRKVILNNGDVIKISNTEITYNNDNPRTSNQADITKQIKQKIFPFTTPRRRSCTVATSSVKKAPASFRLGTNNKQSLFSPSPLIVKKNLPPKHNDDWPSEPLDRDQFPFVGHFSPQKSERPLQEIPDTMTTLEDTLKPSLPSLVNVVAPTVRTSTCTSTSEFDKMKTEEAIIPDTRNITLVAENSKDDGPLKSFQKPNVHGSILKTSRRQNRSSSCTTPSKVSVPLKSRLTVSEHKLFNESQPSFLQSDSIEMGNSTISSEHETLEMNSSTPTSASRTSNTLTLLGTPTSTIKKRDSIFIQSASLNKTDKANYLDTSEAREKSKSRLFDQSLESVDGDSLALSTDTSSFVYESALSVLPSANDFEVEKTIKDAQSSIASSLNSFTIAPSNSDISGIASLARTPEPKTSIYKTMDLFSDIESTSNQADLSFDGTVFVDLNDDTLRNSNIEVVPNYSSITISSHEDLDCSDASSENSDVITEDEVILLRSEDEMEIIRKDANRMSLDVEPEPDLDICQFKARTSLRRSTQTLKTDNQVQETDEEVVPINTKLQSPARMSSITVEENTSKVIQESEDGIGNGSSLILTIDQDDETSNKSIVIEKTVNKTFTLSPTPVKVTENSEILSTTGQIDDVEENAAQIEENEPCFQNCEEINNSVETRNFQSFGTSQHLVRDWIEDNDDYLDTEQNETVPERKSTRVSKIIDISDSEDTDCSTASDDKSKRNSKLLRTPIKNSPDISEVLPPLIRINDVTFDMINFEDTKASTTSDSKSKRNVEVFHTSVKNSPAVSQVGSRKKSILETSSLQEDTNGITAVQMQSICIDEDSVESEDINTSAVIQTPSIQGSPIASGVRSTRKSQVFKTPLSKDNDVTVLEDSESLDGSVLTENVESEGILAASDRKSRRISKTPLVSDSSVTTAVRSARKSKVFQTPLQYEETSESSDPENMYALQTSSIQRSPATPVVRSTRKSRIVQTPLLQDDENLESEGTLAATDRKSRRISNLQKALSVSDSPVTSGVVFTRKSKILETPLLQEASESGDFIDIDVSVLTENNLKPESTVLEMSSVQCTPVGLAVRSARKSKIVPTPVLQDDENIESDGTATARKSRRISNTPLVSDLSITSEVGSTRKSKVLETPSLQDEESSESSDAEHMYALQTPSIQRSPATPVVRSTRKSRIVQTPLLQDEENVESEGTLTATDRKSRRISNLPKTPTISDSSVTSGVESTRKSKILETLVMHEEEASDSGDSIDMDDSVLTENNSKPESALLEMSPVQCTPVALAVRSTRKSKIVPTPVLEDDENIESDGTATDRKSRRISNLPKTPLVSDSSVTTGVRSTRKSKVLETPLLQDEESSESSDAEHMYALQTPPIQRSPATPVVRSTRKSRIVQTPLLQVDENNASEGTAATDRKSRRISNLPKTPSISDSSVTSEVESTRKSKILETPLIQEEEASESSDSENMDSSVFTENNSRSESTLLETPSVQRTPASLAVRSTRKSKIIPTPVLQDDENMESDGTSSATDRKSRRISNLSKTPSISDSSVTSAIGSTRKSKIVETHSMQEEADASESSDSEDMDDSVFLENNSRQESILLPTTPIQSTPAAPVVKSTRKSESNLAATDRKSRRISNLSKTPSISNSSVTSEIGSTRKSKILKTPVVQDATSESGDSVFTGNNSSTESTLLETPSTQRTPSAPAVTSTRKSKIVPTPALQDDENVESESNLTATDRKSRRISNVPKTPSISDSSVTSRIESTRKSKIQKTPVVQDEEASGSNDSEAIDEDFAENDSRQESTLLETPSIQRTPGAAAVRSTRKSKIIPTPLLQDDENIESEDSTVTSGTGTTRKSKILKTPIVQEEEDSESSDSEAMDGSVFTDNDSRRESTLLETPSIQRTSGAPVVRSTRKSKIVPTPLLQDDENIESEDSSVTSGTVSTRKSMSLKTSSVQSEETFESGDSVFTENNSKRESTLLKTPSIQHTPVVPVVRSSRKSKIVPTPVLQNDENIESEGSSVTSRIESARKSKILKTPMVEDEDSESSDSEAMDGSIFTENDSRRESTLLETPSIQRTPGAPVVRSTRKSKIVPSPVLQVDENIESKDSSVTSGTGSTRKSKNLKTPVVQNDEVFESGDSVFTENNSSTLLRTPSNQRTPAEVRSTRKSKIIQTPSLQDDIEGNTDENINKTEDSDKVAVSPIVAKKPRTSKLLQTPQNSPNTSGVRSAKKSKILQTPLANQETAVSQDEIETVNKSKRVSNLLQTPTIQSSPIATNVRSTRKSKISKTPLLLSNDTNVETEEMDALNTPVNKSKLLSTPQSTSTKKSKISVTPMVQEEANTSTASSIKSKRTSKILQTPSLQDAEISNTQVSSIAKSRKSSKLLPTPSNQNSGDTPVTSGIQVKRTSRVLKTPSIQELNQTNSPLASGIKSKRMSKLQQTPVLQEEANLPNVSGKKSVTPKNVEKSKTPVLSASKTSILAFEEMDSPVTSPVKKRNTSKVLTFNTPTDQDETEVECSPASKRGKIGRRTVKTEPHNDLTNIQGVKSLFKTPKVQKQPHNDLTDVRGVKNILKTPKIIKEPQNDLTNIKGVKKLMATPKVQNSPANDLTKVGGVKKLMTTPTAQKSPKNDLSDVRGVKKLVVTPKPRKSANLSGLVDFFASTSKKTTPKQILDKKKSKKLLKVQNSPKNDLTNVVGVKKMFAEEEAQYKKDFNVSGVAEIMNQHDELFNSLLEKKPLKTYGRKTTPSKVDVSVDKSVVSGTPVMSEEVVNWVNTQDFNKGEIIDNLTPIRSKNNENLVLSKKKDVEIHSSTPLNQDNRGILKEIEGNTQNVKLSDIAKDKNLKKVQFLDDSNLRKSKRTPRKPSKITDEFVIIASKKGQGRKRKVEVNDDLDKELIKVRKVVSPVKNDSVIVINTETEAEDASIRKVVTKRALKKAPKSRSKKAIQLISYDDEIEEEKKDVEVPKPTRSRSVKKANTKSNKKVVEVENDEGIKASENESTENKKVETPKTRSGRSVKKNAKTTKKVEKIESTDKEEIEEIETSKTTRSRPLKKTDAKTNKKVDVAESRSSDIESEEVEAPKTTRGRALMKTDVITDEVNQAYSHSSDVESEETVAPKTARGRLLKKNNAKTNKKVDEVENENSHEEIKSPKTTRARPLQKTNAKTKKVDEVENENSDEEIKSPKTTRSRRLKKTNAKTNKKVDEVENENSDQEVEAPKTTLDSSLKKTNAKTNKKVDVVENENSDEEIEAPKTTRRRPLKKTDAKIKKIVDEVKNENINEEIESPKTTRGRQLKKTSAKTNKKVDEVENENSEVEIEVPRTRRGPVSNKNNVKAEKVENDNNDEEIIAAKNAQGRFVKKTNAKSNKSVENTENDSNDEDTEAPETTRGPMKKTTAKASKKVIEESRKESLVEEKNESLKTTRSRKVALKAEPEEKQLDSTVEIFSNEEVIEVPKKTRGRLASKTNTNLPERSTRQRVAAKEKKVTDGETSINSTMESSRVKTEDISVTLPKTTRARGIKRNLEEEQQEKSITANSKKNNKKIKVENDSQIEKEAETSKTTRRRPIKNEKKVVVEESEDKNEIVAKASRGRLRVIKTNKNSIENSEMEESKNEDTNKVVRSRRIKVEVKSENKTEEEESTTSKTRRKRKLYSLDDSIKCDTEEEVEVKVKKVSSRTRNVKDKTEIVASVRSSKRTRK